MPQIQRPTEPLAYPTRSFDYLNDVKSNDNDINSSTPNGLDHSKVSLDIIIVGAGIAGLSAAVALALDGHHIRIYEQASALAEIGAGIQVPPNSGRILHSWGLQDKLKDKAVQAKGLLWKRWQDGKLIGIARYLPDFPRWYGVPYYVVHRAHLHEILHERAVELGVEVYLGVRILEFDLESACLHLEEETVRADLVVAADGIKSRARETINGTHGQRLMSHNMAAYRATVPVDVMRADRLVRENIDTESINWWVGHNSHVMSYGIVGSKIWNIVANVHETREPEDWDTDENVSVAHLQSLYKDWDPALTRLLSMAIETSKWPVQDIVIPEKRISPSHTLVLIGDGANAMLPFMAQGGAQAVEDACALAQALKLMEDRSRLGHALDVFQRVRRARTSAMHQASRCHAYTAHLPDGPEQRARDAAMEDEVAGRHFIRSPNHMSDPMTQMWAYGYEAAEEIIKAWEG